MAHTPKLTKTEKEILTIVAKGHTNEEAAADRVCSVRTITFHLHNIYSKLGVNRRMKAVLRARELGLIA